MKKTANIFIVNEGKVLLFHRDNKPGISDPDCWGFVGGEVEEGETFLEGLRREIKEEINLEIEDPFRLGKTIISGWGENVFYFVKISSEEMEKIKLGDEGQEVKFFSFKEVFKLKLAKGPSWYFNNFSKGIKNLIEKEEIDEQLLGFNENGELFVSLSDIR
jgi:ADP-ribose pyrophosphatase YjhB (NUDIX family)